jgi:hypothetical protein
VLGLLALSIGASQGNTHDQLLERAFQESRRRTKVIPHFFTVILSAHKGEESRLSRTRPFASLRVTWEFIFYGS